jgi:hypothetical protein
MGMTDTSVEDLRKESVVVLGAAGEAVTIMVDVGAWVWLLWVCPCPAIVGIDEASRIG